VKLDVKIGLIPCGILRHIQIYSRYDYYRRLGHKATQAVLFTAEDMQVQERWIYNIIKKMEKEI